MRSSALTVGVAAVLALAGCADGSDPSPTSGEVSASDTPNPSPTESSEPPAESTDSPEDTWSALPIYFAGDAPDGLRLFREFTRGTTADALNEAAHIVDGGAANDPDYRTLWPGQTISAVSATDEAIVVQLEADAFTEAPDGMSKREAKLAIQQLIYTLQGVQQDRLPVQFTRATGPARLFGISIEEPIEQAPALRVLNHVNITSPDHGATVSPGPLQIDGVANSFEANVVCSVEEGDREPTPFTADGWMGNKLFPFAGELDLSGMAAGAVTISCSTDDPSDGEGIGAMTDTKVVTIQ